MEALDVIAVIGEVFSWLGLLLGIPLLVLALVVRLALGMHDVVVPPAVRVMLTLGIVLTAVGVLGFLASWLPILAT